VNAVHDSLIEAFVAGLRAAVDEVAAAGTTGKQGAYGTVS
jgi:hypothetical protein